MNNQDYEQKKRECWEEFKNAAFNGNTYSTYSALDFAFDCAYALGKQEKDGEEASLWNRLTDDEKREMRCRYHTNECVLRDHRKHTGDKAQSKAVARMKLLENLFGKENLKNQNNG